MKKTLLLLSLCSTAMMGWGQSSGKTGLTPVAASHKLNNHATEKSQVKTLACVDTLRYPQAKEQILGTSNFYTLDIWQSDGEAFSQTYLNTGTLSITGVEFFGANNDVDGTPSVTVTASIYNVNASNVPTTLVSTGTTTFTSNVEAYHYVNFSTPATVTGNYAVVVQATSANGIFTFFVNDALAGQPYDELYARFKSNYYASSSGAWISIPAFTEIGARNFEPLVAPLVNYSINTQFTPSATTVCQGTPVTYTNGTTPTGALTNRMMNYQIFRTYFGLATSDSTYVYDMDNASPYIWTGTTTYTHPAAGAYDVLLGTNGGFWNSCFDYTTHTVTVNPAPAAPTITPGGPTTFCAGGNVVLTSSAPSGNTWSNTSTNTSITVTTSGSYTATVTAGGCTSTASAPVVVTVNPLDNATFNYPSSTVCTGGSNVMPTAATAGTYTSAPGLVFVSATTGEVDMTTSADGTYTVTHTTGGACPNSSTQTLTITAAPDATFTYGQTAYCTAATDPAPAFGMGASAGTFTSAVGLAINSSTGVIDLGASDEGTYTITNSIAASGSCPAASETFDVTISESPTSTIQGGGDFCGNVSAELSIELTGDGPWDITYTDGTTPVTVTGVTTSPYDFNVTTDGSYSVTAVTMGSCTNAGQGTAVVAFHPNPVVTISPVDDVCENDAAFTLVASPAGGGFGGVGVVGNTFDPSGLAAGDYTVTYGYTDANGCAGTASEIVTVNALPVVTLGSFNNMCVYNDEIALSGGAPAGGNYSVNGTGSTTFDPAAEGLGTSTVVYSYSDANGCSSSATQDILVDACLGVEESILTEVTLSPNPTNGSFVIDANGAEGVVYTVLTEDGRVVVAPKALATGLSETVELSEYAKGVYFVHLTSAKGMKTMKVMLQ